MNLSQIQLNHYFVSDLNVSANKQHKPNEEITLSSDDVVVKRSCVPVADDDPFQWQVTLDIAQQTGENANAPYFFSMQIVGFFEVHKECPEDRILDLVDINGTSVLYGTSREIIRNAMCSGPFLPMLLPTAVFIPGDRTKEVATLSDT